MHNMWNKEEELDACVQLQGYNPIDTTETLYENSHDRSACRGQIWTLRKDKPGWWGVGVALYMTAQYEHMELSLSTDDEPVKSLSQD